MFHNNISQHHTLYWDLLVSEPTSQFFSNEYANGQRFHCDKWCGNFWCSNTVVSFWYISMAYELRLYCSLAIHKPLEKLSLAFFTNPLNVMFLWTITLVVPALLIGVIFPYKSFHSYSSTIFCAVCLHNFFQSPFYKMLIFIHYIHYPLYFLRICENRIFYRV